MSYWDSSALVKLYVQELDSDELRELALKASRVATGSLTRHEVREKALKHCQKFLSILKQKGTEPFVTSALSLTVV